MIPKQNILMKKIRRGCIPLGVFLFYFTRYYWGCAVTEWFKAVERETKGNPKDPIFVLGNFNTLEKFTLIRLLLRHTNMLAIETKAFKTYVSWGDLSFYMTEGNVSFHCTWCHEMFLEQAELYIELRQSKSLLLDAVLPDMMLEISRFHLQC